MTAERDARAESAPAGAPGRGRGRAPEPPAGARRPAPRVERRRRALLLAALGLALAASLRGLALAVEHRAGLERLYGAPFGAALLGLRAAAAVCALAIAVRALGWVTGRGRPVRPALARRLVVVLVGAHAAFLALAQPYERLHLDLALGLAGGAFAALVLLERPLGAILQPWAGRALDLALFSLAVAAVLAEASLRAWGAVDPRPLLSVGGAEARRTVEAYRYAPGHVRFGAPMNAAGFFDGELWAKREGEPLVACIGDSFSIGTVPLAHHYTTVAERVLGGAVHNLGVPSIGLPEYLYLLESEALPLAPDLVVVALFLGNDLHEGLVERRGTGLLRSLFDRSTVRLWVVPQRVLRARSEARRLAGTGGAARAAAGGADPPWIADPLLEPPGFTHAGYLRIESQRARNVCGTAGLDPARGEGVRWPVVFEWLAAIAAAARPTPLVFLLIPDEFQVDDELWARVRADLAARGVQLDRDRPQRLLTAWLAERGLDYVDLLPALRAAEPLADGRPHLYHANDTHFNARGNRVAGEVLGAALRERLVD